MLLSMIFNYLFKIIDARMIFWWLIENLAESSLKLIFTLTSQLLYWTIMLLYTSFDISDMLILMLLCSDRSAGQLKSLFTFMRIIESSEMSDSLFLLNMLFHSNNFRKVLCWIIWISSSSTTMPLALFLLQSKRAFSSWWNSTRLL